MKTSLLSTFWHFIILTVAFLKFQHSEAQCSDSFIRPADGFQLQGWSPRCHNGTDGEIRISGITSTLGQGDFTNQSYAVRIISGPNGASTIPITPNSASFTLTGLAAGTYLLDIIDQCGGNSSDKTVTLVNPPRNSSLTPTTHIFKDITINPALSGCGNILKYRITITSTNTAGDVVCVFTNNSGNTLTFTKPIERAPQPTNKVVFLDIDIPTAFFNGQNITYTVSNYCGALQGGTIALPVTNNIVFGTPSITDTSDPQNQCFIGYDIKAFREFMTNPITITVEEAANPGVTPLNFLGQPITPRLLNLLHLNSVPMGMATPIPLGLKYNTHYNITFTDVCGKTITKNMVQTVTPFNPALTCNTDSSVADVAGYFDDAALLKFNGVAISSNAVGPLTITVNSGPTTYTTSSGTGNSVSTSNIQYPYSTIYTSPFLHDYVLNDYIRTFPPGNYNITITDACGKSHTFNQTVSCGRNFNISHTLQTCGNITNSSIGVLLNIPKALLGTRATVYKADGSVALTGIINSGSPFYYVGASSLGTLNFNVPNNNQYFFRYGGVNENGELSEPAQFGGVGALPRLQGGYLYEYAFQTALAPFRFEAIQACGTSVSMTATGGTTPYTFTILDASGNTQLFPNQSTASFSNLTTGITYTAKAIDACGREFTQQFEVFALPVANLESIIQPNCQNETGSVTINNLPADWTIVANPGNVEYSGSTPSFAINNLQPGNYTFVVTDNLTTCTANQSLQVTLNPVPLCPIASNDITTYESGQPITVNVTENDTTGAIVNPTTVSLVAQTNSTNIETENGCVISMVTPYEGTWNVNTVTGQISFHPFLSFLGSPTAIEYNVKDFYGNISNNALVSTDILPIAVNDVTYYNPGNPVTINIITNDTPGDRVNPETITLVLPEGSSQNSPGNTSQLLQVLIPNEGNWTINTISGMATFIPLPGFVGLPSTQRYQVRDYEGNLSNIATIELKLRCNFTVTCPTFPAVTVSCYEEIPSTGTLTETEFESLGNADGNIGNNTCGNIVITATNTPFSGCNSQVERTYTITEFLDNNGNGIRDLGENTILNTTICSQIFHVNDTIFPTFNETVPENLTVACDAVPEPAILTATDNCGSAMVVFNENTTTGSCIGNYSIIRTWTATDNCGNSNTHTQIINVTDQTAPVFNETLPENLTVECVAVPIAAVLTATDNCGSAEVGFYENTVAGTCPGNYTIIRTWTATDNCGNYKTHTQTINVVDYTAPIFNEQLPPDITLENTATVPPPATLTASDNCGTATVFFEEETLNGTCPGNTEIIRSWRAVDACGNEIVHIQAISLIDTTPPTFTGDLPQDQTLACDKIPTAPVLTATDNSAEVTITFEEDEVEGNCKSKYSLVRTWTATDSCGNTATHVQTLYLNCQVTVYNAVSPDGDGKNDIFYLEGIECFPDNSVEIFNRWGAKVFDTQGYDNTSNVFRGQSEGKNTISKNEALPTGTYFYILRYDFTADGKQHEKIEKTGYLYVVNK